ncbi:Neuroligin-4, X-linked-like protein [Aphelenchoides fujianensis]|nr:Neuroligin-4, X-linked-like protein [Aphelenchoides fujianensis]
MIFLNHRFGVFGFLDVGDEDAAEFPYNVGLQDVIQALRWIKREARAFNGDPDRLTAYVFRDSATLVQLLLVSPAVQREEMPMDRILLNNHRPLLQPHANRQPTARLLESVGCAVDEDGRPLDSKQKVACLRSKSMEELWRQSPGQHAFGPQTDARLLPAESFAELVANWKPSSVYTISGENVPFAEDRGRSVDELCRLYAAHTFGYRSAAVAQRCAWRYASLPNGAALIGRHAAHAMNALLGARNNRSGGTTFAARFAQPTEDGGDFRFIFADHQPETAAEHRVHEFMLETREQFGHRRRAPAADFLPVDAEGRNFYDVRAETAEDGRTLMAEPRMYVGAWPDADGVDFWLRELRDVEAASRAATRTPRPPRLHAVDPPEAAQEGSWDEHPAAALWMVVAVVVLLLAAFLWVLDRKYQRKEVVGGKKATVRRSYASFDEI